MLQGDMFSCYKAVALKLPWKLLQTCIWFHYSTRHSMSTSVLVVSVIEIELKHWEFNHTVTALGQITDNAVKVSCESSDTSFEYCSTRKGVCIFPFVQFQSKICIALASGNIYCSYTDDKCRTNQMNCLIRFIWSYYQQGSTPTFFIW